jgi:hypothetical protein
MVGSNTKANSYNDNTVLCEVIVVETALYSWPFLFEALGEGCRRIL